MDTPSAGVMLDAPDTKPEPAMLDVVVMPLDVVIADATSADAVTVEALDNPAALLGALSAVDCAVSVPALLVPDALVIVAVLPADTEGTHPSGLSPHAGDPQVI